MAPSMLCQRQAMPSSRRIRRVLPATGREKSQRVAIVESVREPRWHYRIHAAKLPLAARTQHINDGGKDLSGGNRLASRAGLSTITGVRQSV